MLEKKFKDNEEELNKIKKIIVIDENHISIGWFIHKLWTVKAKTEILSDGSILWAIELNYGSFAKDVVSKWNMTFFGQQAAITSLENSWYTLYSQIEMQNLINAIPWKNKNNIMIELLQIDTIWWMEPAWFDRRFLWYKHAGLDQISIWTSDIKWEPWEKRPFYKPDKVSTLIWTGLIINKFTDIPELHDFHLACLNTVFVHKI